MRRVKEEGVKRKRRVEKLEEDRWEWRECKEITMKLLKERWMERTVKY